MATVSQIESLQQDIDVPEFVIKAARTWRERISDKDTKSGSRRPVQPGRDSEYSTGELVEPLTDRELEILRLIQAGFTNQEISDRLFLALNTTKWYNSNIFSKLGVKNRTQAVAEAQRLGLLTR